MGFFNVLKRKKMTPHSKSRQEKTTWSKQNRELPAVGGRSLQGPAALSRSPGCSTETRELPALGVRTAAVRRQCRLDPQRGGIELNEVWQQSTSLLPLFHSHKWNVSPGWHEASLSASPRGRRAAQWRQVVVARDVAVDREVVVAQGVFVRARGVAE